MNGLADCVLHFSVVWRVEVRLPNAAADGAEGDAKRDNRND
jgi:hypothetical protein